MRMIRKLTQKKNNKQKNHSTLNTQHSTFAIEDRAMPTQGEKDAAIEAILSKGLKRPQSIGAQFREMYHVLGLRSVFWDTAWALVLSVMAVVPIFFAQLIFPTDYKYTVLFSFSPLFFVLAVLITETVERSDGLYELKMTCKYTIRQITVFRVFCFALAGVVVSAGAAAAYADSMSQFYSLLPISFSALFLCAFLFLFLMRRFARRWVFGLSAIVWVLAALIPALVFGGRWESFLSGLPAAITIAAAVCAGGLCLHEIGKLGWSSTARFES